MSQRKLLFICTRKIVLKHDFGDIWSSFMSRKYISIYTVYPGQIQNKIDYCLEKIESFKSYKLAKIKNGEQCDSEFYNTFLFVSFF